MPFRWVALVVTLLCVIALWDNLVYNHQLWVNIGANHHTKVIGVSQRPTQPVLSKRSGPGHTYLSQQAVAVHPEAKSNSKSPEEMQSASYLRYTIAVKVLPYLAVISAVVTSWMMRVMHKAAHQSPEDIQLDTASIAPQATGARLASPYFKGYPTLVKSHTLSSGMSLHCHPQSSPPPPSEIPSLKLATSYYPWAVRPSQRRLYLMELAHGHHSHEEDEQAKQCERVTIIGGIVNVLLMAFKATAGYLGNSTAMIADAAHTMGDLVGDILSYLVIHEARKPADQDHPFGHGKFESIGAFGIAMLLMLTSVETGKSSASALWEMFAAGGGVAGETGWIAAVAAIACIVAKELMYRVTIWAGMRANSPATVANAYHHRSDAFTSMVALVGIVAARLGWAWCDPLAGLAVSMFIAKAGWQIGVDAFEDLVDTAADVEKLGLHTCLEAIVPGLPGVVKYDDLRARQSGPYVAVSFNLHVKPSMSVATAHDVQHTLKQQISNTVQDVRDVMITLVPAQPVQPAVA